LGGHSPVANQYGLGSDQFLEFKIVTPDGQLRIANSASNADLFWALRGGGGGTFGVVIEATVKAYPHVPITAYSWWMNSSTAGIGSTLGNMIGLGGNAADGMFDAVEALAQGMPDLNDKALSTYIYMFPWFMRGVSIAVGENATAKYTTESWKPVLTKMKGMKGMMEPQIKIFQFDNYQDFYDYTYESGMRRRYKSAVVAGSAEGTREPSCSCKVGSSSKMLKRHGPEGDMPAKPASAASNATAAVCPCTGKLMRRHGPEGDMPVAPAGPAPTKIADPMTPGIINLDSILLDAKAMRHPDYKKALKNMPALGFGWLPSGNKVSRPDDETSVNPAWRSAVVHNMGMKIGPIDLLKPLKNLAPDAGAYGNEVLTIRSGPWQSH